MKLFVTPLSQLEQTLSRSGARRMITLLSDGAVFSRPRAVRQQDCLRLTFHDIAAPREGLTAPTPEDVAEILRFAQAGNPRASLLIHCHAGISRSTAAAYLIACAMRPDWREDSIATELRRLSPSATPNPLMVAHADLHLGRNGRMAAAIRGIGRGGDAFEGTPFCLDLA